MSRATPPGLFAAWRIALGLWLLSLFAGLWPWRMELYGAGGFPQIDAFWMVFPNLLRGHDSRPVISALFGVAMGASLSFTLGFYRRVCAVLLWFLLATLCARDPVVFNLSWNYVGWSLLASALVPPGEPRWPGGAAAPGWEMPRELYAGACAILALSYTVSGLSKLGRPEWAQGEAIGMLLRSPVAWDLPWVDLLLRWPTLLRVLSYFTLAAEILSLPMSVTRRGRALAWGAMTLVHLGILATVQLSSLSLGVLTFHLLTLDARWFRRSGFGLLHPTIDVAGEAPGLRGVDGAGA